MVTSTANSSRLPAPRRVSMRSLLVTGSAWTLMLIFAWVLAGLVSRGWSALDLAFLTQAPSAAGRDGGVAPILVATLWILAASLALCVPLGLGTALWLAEYCPRKSRVGRWVRLSLDALAGVPSIVFALFGNAFFVVILAMGYSILAGGLTLGCMSLPLFVRAAEDGLRAVPDEQRYAAAALGISRTCILTRIVLPRAVPGIVVGVVLVIARTLSGTAPMMFTSGYVTRMPGSVMDSGRGLALHIYDLSMNVPGGERHAAASALLLVMLLLILNGAAAWLGTRILGRRALPT